MQQEIVTLSNGLKTLLIDAPGSSMGSIQTWFKAGSSLEDKENHGIAHFLEHMFFKGTEKRPGFRIAHDVESFGGEINAFTSFDYTCYYINCPQDKILNSVDILMDMVSEPVFRDEDIIPEIGVVFEEYRRSQDSPSQFSFQKLQQIAFAGSYGHPILGSENHIKNFNRDQLIAFRKKFYNSSNFLLVVSGDLNQRKDIIKKIEKYHLPEGPSSSFPKFKLKSKSKVSIHKKDVSMLQLNIAIEAPPMNSPKAASEDLAIASLGQGETSLLHQELVMKQTLATSASSSTIFFADGGLHMIRVSMPVENLEKVKKELIKLLKSVCEKGIKESALEKIKNQYVASKVYEKESLESYSFALGHGLIQYDDIEADNKFINAVKSVSFKNVRNSLNDIFSSPLLISVQIPEENKIEPIKKSCENLLTNLEKISSRKNKAITTGHKMTKSKYDPQVKTITIKPGIKLLYRHNPISPSFVFHSYIKGGLEKENPNNNGIHHMISSLMTKGYKGCTYQKVKNDIATKAASINGFAGKNAYGLTMHGQADHFKDLLKHFFGTLKTPTMQAKFFKHEMELAKRNLEYQLKDPVKTCFREMSDIIFGDHYYSYNLIGNENSLKKIKRQDVLDLHLKNLKTREILFTYCGSHSLEEVIEIVEQNTADFKGRKTTKPNQVKLSSKVTNKHINFDREQTQILITTPAPYLGHKDNSYLKILTTHLSGQSSELFVDVRDRQGLCYTAQPIHFTALEAGYWGIYMASGHDKVKAAKAALYNLIEKIAINGLSQRDFERVKEMIDGQEKVSIQTNDDYAGIYSIPELHGFGVDYYHKSNNAIKNMQYEDFQKNIKRILSKKFNELIVGRP